MRRLFAFSALLMVVAACTQAPVPTTAPDPAPTPSPTVTPYVATVNGTPIPRPLFERRLEVQKALIQGFDLESEQGRAIEAQLAVDTLNQMIDTLILKQAAAAVGITVTPDEIEGRLNAPASGEAWGLMQSALASQSVDPEYYRMLIEQQILSEKLMDVVVTNVPTATEQVRLRRIAVETEEEAKAVQAELQAGRDFAEVAQARSLDPESRARGGDVGFYPRGIIAPEVEQVAFSLPVGGASEPLKTPLGYEIIQVAERALNRPVAPEYQRLIRERRFTEWLKQERAAATIEYADAKG